MLWVTGRNDCPIEKSPFASEREGTEGDDSPHPPTATWQQPAAAEKEREM